MSTMYTYYTVSTTYTYYTVSTTYTYNIMYIGITTYII